MDTLIKRFRTNKDSLSRNPDAWEGGGGAEYADSK